MSSEYRFLAGFAVLILLGSGCGRADPTDGDGDWISLYLPLDTAFRFYRLFAR